MVCHFCLDQKFIGCFWLAIMITTMKVYINPPSTSIYHKIDMSAVQHRRFISDKLSDSGKS